MRANWLTSIIAAPVFLALFTFENEVVQAIGFFVIMLVGVVGVPQLREAFAEMRRRRVRCLCEAQDFDHFYMPAWGRMLLWFLTCGAFAYLMHLAST